MPATYEPIGTQTLGSTAASVTFSSIPSTYTDLVLIVDFAASAGGVNNGVTINGDTSTSNYAETDFGGSGSGSATSGRSQVLGYIRAGYVDTTSERALSIVNFMNYSNSTTQKNVLIRWNSNSYVFARVALWKNTNAITSITNTAIGSTFAVGSIFTLYGIKAA
jgi:hypothetical protein